MEVKKQGKKPKYWTIKFGPEVFDRDKCVIIRPKGSDKLQIYGEKEDILWQELQSLKDDNVKLKNMLTNVEKNRAALAEENATMVEKIAEQQLIILESTEIRADMSKQLLKLTREMNKK